MNTAREKCVWYAECEDQCEDCFLIDTSEEDEEFYRHVLKENTEEYDKLILEFSEKEEI